MDIDMLIGGQAAGRPPIDVVAEALWQVVVGDGCQDCWDKLTNDQKEWWRECAMNAIADG